MSVLFLADQITRSFESTSYGKRRTVGRDCERGSDRDMDAFATCTTAIYFHTPFEKLTGFRTFVYFFPF
jgi:hypothetical protein